MAERLRNTGDISLMGPDFAAAMREIRDADKKLYRELRKSIRTAAAPIVADVRRNIDLIPSYSNHTRGIRDALKRGTRVGVYIANPKTAGIRIVTDPRYLDKADRYVAKAMNQTWFRHPVFARTGGIRDSRTRGARYSKALWGGLGGAGAAIPARLGGGTVDGAWLTEWKWVEQRGRPYFGSVILSHRADVGQVIVRNVNTALFKISEKVEGANRA